MQSQPQYTITDADKQRQKRIADAWKAYNGDFPPSLLPQPDQPDCNTPANRCQAIVDRGVDFLFAKVVAITVSDGAPQEAQDFLDKVWGRNETKMALLQDLATSGGVSGQPFLRIVPFGQGANQTFRLVILDPSTISVQHANQDYQTVLLFCIEYSCSQSIGGKPMDVYFHEEIFRIDPTPDAEVDGYEDEDSDGIDQQVTWSIQHWTRIGDRGPWQSAGDPIAWPYDFPPLFTCQNASKPHDFWGRSDLTPDLVKTNMGINDVQSDIKQISGLYGEPILYAPGTGGTTINRSRGRIIQLPMTDQKIEAVALSTDLANQLLFLSTLRTNMDEQSGVPGVALGREQDLPKGQVSGVTMELLFMPLLTKTERKRCRYGELIIDVSRALLVLAGFSPDIDVSLAWQNPLPHDDLQSAQAVLALQQAGASVDTTLKMMGLDPDQEQAKVQAEAAQKQVAFSRGQGMPPPAAAVPTPQAPGSGQTTATSVAGGGNQ